VRCINSRGLRFKLVAGLGIAFLMPALAMAAGTSQGLATQTTLTAQTRDLAGHTKATLAIAVTGDDGLPAAGAVTIKDNGKPLAGVALGADGQAKATLDLTAGKHALSAVYAGDATHQVSTSKAATVSALDSAPSPSFAVSVSPTSVTLTPGQSGDVTVTVTPANNSSLTAPMFVGISCNPPSDEFTCTANPASVEILSTTPTSCATGSAAASCPPTSTMVLQTYTATSSRLNQKPKSSPIAWAFLLPGVLGLGGLAWGARRKRWLSQLSLIAMVGMVTMLGTTACNPRYSYLNHSPLPGTATPAGTYTVSVNGVYSNSVTSLSSSTSFTLTVK